MSGSVSDQGGTTTFDLKLNLGGSQSWKIGSVATVGGLTAELSDGPIPTGCPTSIGSGDVWINLAGSATLTLPSATSAATVGIMSCIDPATGNFALASTANLGHYEPISGVNLALDSASVTVDSTNGDITGSLAGTLDVFGVGSRDCWPSCPPRHGRRHQRRPPGRGHVDPSKLGLPLPSASVLYASEAINNLALVPGLATQIGLTPSELADIPADAGFTALTDWNLPTSLASFLDGTWRASPSRPLATPPPSSSPSTSRLGADDYGNVEFRYGWHLVVQHLEGTAGVVCG